MTTHDAAPDAEAIHLFRTMKALQTAQADIIASYRLAEIALRRELAAATATVARLEGERDHARAWARYHYDDSCWESDRHNAAAATPPVEAIVPYGVPEDAADGWSGWLCRFDTDIQS